MKKIRVVSLINELLHGGDENRLLSFSRSVDTARFEHRVVCIKRPNPNVEAFYGTMRDQYAAAGIDVSDLDEGHPNEGVRPGSPALIVNRTVMLVRTVSRLCRMIRKRRIDLIDARLGPGSLVGVAAGALTATPVSITTYHVEQWEPLWLWRRVHPAVLRAAAAVITDSEACANDIRTFMRRPKADVAVIPNGIDAPTSTLSAEQARHLFDLPVDPDIRVVGQVATLLATKGHMALVDAAKIVLDRVPNTAFLIVGYPRDPAYKEALLARVAELGIGNRVRVLGYPGNIGDVWKAIDIHAHPTMLDSLPQAIMEAMSLGLPSVVTPVAGIPTQVEHEKTGFIVPQRDPRALADALIRLLSEPGLALRLGDAARDRYRAKYTIDVMTRSLEALYEASARR